MKRLYGVCSEDGEVYAVYHSEQEAGGLDTVELVPNPSWETDDWTDELTGAHWIKADRLAFLFGELVKKTGMKKKVLASLCGKSCETFSKYCSGIVPVPLLVWEEVEMNV